MFQRATDELWATISVSQIKEQVMQQGSVIQSSGKEGLYVWPFGGLKWI
jgi:hypothetical protein